MALLGRRLTKQVANLTAALPSNSIHREIQMHRILAHALVIATLALGIHTNAEAFTVTCQAGAGQTCAQLKRAPIAVLNGKAVVRAKAIQANGSPLDTTTYAGPLNPIVFSLEITSIAEDDATELTPVRVGYKFSASYLRPGGEVKVTLPDISICGAFIGPNLPCQRVPSPQVGQTYTGSVMATAPWAGMQAQMHIVALESNLVAELQQYVVVADATRQMSTAALYDLNFDGFTLKDTRSNSTDTVWLNVQGQVNSTPPDISASPNACELVGFKWCITGYKYGDAHKSGYRQVSGQTVGPFRLTPEKEQSLNLMFFLFNSGGSKKEIALGVANGFSKAGEAILSAYGAAQGSAATVAFAQVLDGIIEGLHGVWFASCDGPLAVDVGAFMNQSVYKSNANTLDAFTRGSGHFAYTPSIDYRNKDGDFICDRRGSDYTVTFSVTRTSWRDWYEYP